MSTVPDPLKVFQKLHNNSIKDIVSIHYQPTDEDDVLELSKEEQIEALAEDVVASGADALLNSLPRTVLLPLVEGLVLDYPPEKNKSATGVIKKGLYNLIDDVGLEEFLNQLNLTKVKLICHSLKLEEDGEKSTLDKRIIDYVNERGLKAFFSQFVEGELKQWCVDNHLLDSDDHASYSKQSLLQALIQRQQVTKESYKKPEKPHLNLKKRPKIKAGISSADVFQWYNKTELLEYCTKEGISKKGKLRQVATRVAKHANGDKVEMLGESKKRKRGSKGKEKSQKKARVDKNGPKNKEDDKEKEKTKNTEEKDDMKEKEKNVEEEKDDTKEKEKKKSVDTKKKEKE